MDSLSRVSDSLPDIGAAERAQDARWQVRNRSKGTPQHRPKKGKPGPATASGDGRESHGEEASGRPPQTGPGEEAPNQQERSEACYGRDRTIAPILRKGRLIDIAI